MGMNLSQFLGHTANAGSRQKYLTKWKKNNPPQVDIWIHTQSLIESLWRHGIPKLQEKTDKQTGDKTLEVWSDNWTCWEDEEVLQHQYSRDQETGDRAYPPCICPICLLTEYIRSAVEAGDLSWVAPVFYFEGDDPSKAITIHAGGMFGAYGRDDLTREELDELKDNKIWRNHAWKENTMAKLSYVFSVVDNSHPNEGVQIAIETSLLGDKVKEVIANAMIEAEDEGNPMVNPYAIRWIHRPTENEFGKKYNAVKMGKLPLTPEIRRLITETEPPNLKRVVRRHNPKELMAKLMDACVLEDFEIPWEDIFRPSIEEWERMEKENRTGDGTDFPTEEMEKESKKAKPSAARTPKGTKATARGPKAGKATKATPVTRKAAAKQKKELCYNCGEFVETYPCPNCDYDPSPKGASAAQDPDDDLPY